MKKKKNIKKTRRDKKKLNKHIKINIKNKAIKKKIE